MLDTDNRRKRERDRVLRRDLQTLLRDLLRELPRCARADAVQGYLIHTRASERDGEKHGVCVRERETKSE